MRLPLVVLCGLLLSGCETIAYYHQSIQGHFELMAGRRPIARLLDDPDIGPGLKSRLREIEAIRRFATESLGLPDNDSYRSYSDVGRDVLLWNLVAAPEFSLQPRNWCYPVIGCASYRGYFQRRQADAHAARLAAQGLDVAVLPVPAYSSLGWFDDPVPSTVNGWPMPQLAGLIFHELAHQRVYAPDDSAFNESYATVIEEVGVHRWLLAASGPAAVATWRNDQAARRTFIDMIAGARDRLQDIYARSAPVQERRRAKAGALAALRAEFDRRASGEPRLARYRRWFSAELNNAHLVSIDTYHRYVPALRNLLQRQDGDIAAFHAACEELARLSVSERHMRLCGLVAGKDSVQPNLPDRRSDWILSCRSAPPN